MTIVPGAPREAASSANAAAAAPLAPLPLSLPMFTGAQLREQRHRARRALARATIAVAVLFPRRAVRPPRRRALPESRRRVPRRHAAARARRGSDDLGRDPRGLRPRSSVAPACLRPRRRLALLRRVLTVRADGSRTSPPDRRVTEQHSSPTSSRRRLLNHLPAIRRPTDCVARRQRFRLRRLAPSTSRTRRFVFRARSRRAPPRAKRARRFPAASSRRPPPFPPRPIRGLLGPPSQPPGSVDDTSSRAPASHATTLGAALI